MTVLDTQKNYGGVAKFLHWTIAVGFVASYCVIYAKHWFTDEKTTASITMLQLHQAIGISIMGFVIWRVIRRLTGETPAAIESPKWMHVAAKVGHGALYFFMIAMPVTGYVYAKNGTEFFGLLSIPAFGDTSIAHWIMATWDLTLKEGIREPMRVFHREFAGETVLWALILIHVSAALYHHHILRDDVLLRMLPDRLRYGARPRV